jgi:hypothetical protein
MSNYHPTEAEINELKQAVRELRADVISLSEGLANTDEDIQVFQRDVGESFNDFRAALEQESTPWYVRFFENLWMAKR